MLACWILDAPLFVRGEYEKGDETPTSHCKTFIITGYLKNL